MRIWIVVFFLSLGFTVNAQQVINKGIAYEVKGKTIFKEGVDVTETLLSIEKDDIFKTLKSQVEEAKNAGKTRKNLEKTIKKAEKAQKKATTDLKNKQKAQDKFNKASKKLDQNETKYNKLKEKGKLSPNDEIKWFKKLEGYRKSLEKAKKKLQRA